jgi:hypothetical protein
MLEYQTAKMLEYYPQLAIMQAPANLDESMQDYGGSQRVT